MNAQPNPANAQPNLGIKPTTFENPMGIDGFEFVEFASPEPEKLHAYFKMLGFTPVARHKTRKITNYRQGDCTFLINEDPDSFAAEFARQHGPSACGFAVRVNKLAEWVRVQALKNGAEQIGDLELTKAVAAPVIKGIGGCMLYIVDRYDDKGTIHDPDWEWMPGAEMMPKGLGLTFIDHLTHNLYAGNMEKWAGLLRAPVQLPRDPLFRHQGRQDRPAVEGDDRAGRHGAHPAQRIARSEVADQRIPRRLRRRRHPAHRLLHQRHLHDGGGHARGRRRVPGYAGHLFRRGRRARARTTAKTWRGCARTRS